MIPDWLPVKLIASPPSSRMAIEGAPSRCARRGERHVELAPIRVGGHLFEREEVVGGVAAGEDDDEVVALAAGAHHALGHLLHAGDVRDAGAAVLLHYD
jgi:hypothetical protein